jgi:uncharacterized protein (DUF736 family)
MAEKQQSIGAFWEKRGAKGLYLSGQIEIGGVKHAIVAFKNTYKTKDNHPDWRILPSQSPPSGTERAERQSPEQRADVPVIEYPDEDINPDDIPF